MTKYSTGGIGGDSGGACELCGVDGTSLQTETVAGATLEVCAECARHGETKQSSSASADDGRASDRDRRRKAAQNAARLDDARTIETDWESGTDYEDDPLPYLVRGYGQLVEEARQDAGIQTDELAIELDVDEDDLVAVEQGRAARANVGGSVIDALEERFDIELSDE
ncbi:MAG: transcriptional regulator [Natronomonas sp.]|jgi:ribosome-binding protein aMBF1 (putative translation factor)|uniref:transcriptional regulator n=1 Tax=Natronomonas sp. TaxID=2184060 RepID=UPI0028702182|nr:transcriptional regulator [Natronomonas sp.]MDR9381404.1 transcriptional regulator [Natronomonas sp.]MDR9432192.1 transcriptional regulator [Natronomonas sp.]